MLVKMICHVLGGQINMRRRHDCATSLLEYLAAQMRTVPPPSPPVGDGLDSSGGTSVPNGFLVCLQEPLQTDMV